jgi:hypothetical protein
MIMEIELYRKVYQITMDVYRKTNLKRVKFTDADIALIYLWAVLHDRPTCWSCNKKNWPIYYRRRALPAPSTMCRRLRKIGVQQLLRHTETFLINAVGRKICRWIDAKPLTVSGSTTDKQAGFGHAAGCMGKGYKLYAIGDDKQGFVQWRICPMNYSEEVIARELINETDSEGYLVGDSAYDKNSLYEIAGRKAIRFFAPRRYKNSKGLGHHKHSRYRLSALVRLETPFVQDMLEYRDNIERMFGQLTSFGCGLKPLPSWVRGLFRVENWIRGKMIFFQIWRQYVSPNPI